MHATMKRRVLRFQVGPEDHGERLDKFLAARAGELSRSLLRRVIDLGGVHLAGRRVRRCAQAVAVGQTVEIFLDGLPLEPFVLTDRDILYRDRYLLAVNKPPGVEVQPTPARFMGTLYQALLRYLQDPFRPLQRPQLAMVQRLDRGTSGVIIFSIHPRAHKGLTAAFTGRRVTKEYLALAAGKFSSAAGEIRSLLARERATNRMKSVPAGGREAITRYRVVEEAAGASLVEVEIPTGRSHQIRVHLAEAGHPLLGDERYGGPLVWAETAIARPLLHARRLCLRHPVTGENLLLEAPLPADLAGVLDLLRRQGDGASE